MGNSFFRNSVTLASSKWMRVAGRQCGDAANVGSGLYRLGADRALAQGAREHGARFLVDSGQLAGGAAAARSGHHFTTGGRLIRYASGSASVLKPKRVPRS